MFRVEDDLQLNTRVFLWPKDMEAVIELALQRLNMRRDQAENELKYKRQLFERNLTKHAQMLAAFKKKDPPMLTLEEMKENVEIIEGIAEKIKVMFFLTRFDMCN